MPQLIHIHPEAPPKPALGATCNGCGVCCLAEPCPVGVLASRRRHGACAALRWSDEGGRYVCGMLIEPLTALGWAHPGPRWLNRLIGAWARRMIAAGKGCDADLLVQPAPGEQRPH